MVKKQLKLNNMKYIYLLIITLILTSCSVEQRIYNHSYTDSWYYSEKGERYQVYKTARGNKYIIVLNKKETKLIRKYIKLK
jgi:hypothetical protein